MIGPTAGAMKDPALAYEMYVPRSEAVATSATTALASATVLLLPALCRARRTISAEY